MQKKQNNKLESGLSSKSQRYWSIMLVGEHGRVIPFRHFKAVVVAVAGLIVLSLSAALVLVVLYLQQAGDVDHLQTQLSELEAQSAQLKDERDVLRAKLVIKELASDPDASHAAATEKPKTAPAPEVATSQPEPAKELPQAEVAAVEKPAPPPVQWGADIKQFEVQYDHQHDILRTTFRIYNDSKPKERLSGRIVIAFKHSGDPPIKWLVVPNVPLKDSKPATYAGHAFSIRNYQTMDFKAYKPPAPTAYDTVTVFVLMGNGDLLMSRDFGVEIKAPPLPPTREPVSQPTPAISTPEDESPPLEEVQPEDDQPNEDSNEGQETPPPSPPPIDAAPSPDTGASSSLIPTASEIPGASMTGPSVPNKTPEAQGSTVETQPKPEGGTE